jgi:CHASE1-domain containing sensor protein
MIVANRPRNWSRFGDLPLSRYRHVAIAMIAALFLTGFFVEALRDREQSHTQAEMDRLAGSYVAAIQRGIQGNLEVLESIGGLFTASAVVERQEFREFVNGPLSRHQEIQALSWNPRVKDSDRASFEAAA